MLFNRILIVRLVCIVVTALSIDVIKILRRHHNVLLSNIIILKTLSVVWTIDIFGTNQWYVSHGLPNLLLSDLLLSFILTINDLRVSVGRTSRSHCIWKHILDGFCPVDRWIIIRDFGSLSKIFGGRAHSHIILELYLLLLILHNPLLGAWIGWWLLRIDTLSRLIFGFCILLDMVLAPLDRRVFATNSCCFGNRTNFSHLNNWCLDILLWILSVWIVISLISC
jgi:hypothetical protein